MAEKPLTTISECHFGTRAHEDLGSASGLRSLWLEIPDYCHLRCGYCFANTDRRHPHEEPKGLQLADYLKLIDDFHALGGLYMGIPGNGEPFHPKNRDLVMTLLRHATAKGISTTVFTTADTIFYPVACSNYAEAVEGPLDGTLAKELLSLNVILLVKYNSSIPAVQDKLVGQPGYTKVRQRAMEALIQLGFSKEGHRRLGIVTSILPENKAEIHSLFTYARENNLIFDCDTILPRGRGCEWTEKHPVTAHECKVIYDDLNSLNGCQSSPGGSYIGAACDRVKHHLYVDVKGDVHPCIGCVGKHAALTLGNIKADTLEHLWNHRIRKVLREDLSKVIRGPCSWCENFQKTCWSCLGRQVVKCDITDESVILETKGCFNHRPRADHWMAACNREIRHLLLRVGMPGYEGLRQLLLKDLKNYGIEALWSRDGLKDLTDTTLTKDMVYSLAKILGAEVWSRILPEGPQGVIQKKRLAASLAADDKKYLAKLDSLLPRFLVPSLSLLADQYDDPVKLSKTGDILNPGLFQFCLMMFYMPERRHYFYRSMAFNMLDPYSAGLPPVAKESAVPSVQELNHRRVRLIQRWAEPLQEVEAPHILPFIKNFSREMEADHVSTFELVLSTALFSEKAREIDEESQFARRRILGVGRLLDTQAVQSHIKQLAEAVEVVVSSPQQWSEIDHLLSSEVFAWSDSSKVKPLREIYDGLAKHAFYEEKGLTEAEKEGLWHEVSTAISDILCQQVWLFPDTTEKDWFAADLPNRLRDFDWSSFLEMTHRDRRKNLLALQLPKILERKLPLDDPKRLCVMDRLYNRLLVEFVRLFRGDDGKRNPDWIKAVNYFIWLGYFRDFLGIQDYFVLHAPNLQQHCSVLFQDKAERLPAGGLIFSSASRLPVEMREACEELFRTIISPIEELSFANVNSETAKKAGYKQIEYAISHDLDTPLGVLFKEWDRFSDDGRLAVGYLEMWRRFAKRDFKEPLPEALDAVFNDPEALLRMLFFLAYERAWRRGKLPSKLDQGYLRKWTRDELFNEREKWLEVSLEMPKEFTAVSDIISSQLKVWLMFTLIGACYHAIRYAFENVRRFDDWGHADEVRHGFISLFSRLDRSGGTEIVIQNSGTEISDEASAIEKMRDNMAIGSSSLGTVSLAEVQGGDGLIRQIEVSPSVKKSNRKHKEYWEVVISITTKEA